MGNGMKIAFFISLALNIFIVGVFAGNKLSGPDDRREIAGTNEDAINPIRVMRHARALPPESRKLFRDVLRPNMPEMRAKRRALRERQRDYTQALSAPEWDRARVEAAQKEMEFARVEFTAFANEVFIEAIDKLSPEDREILREEARRQHQRRRENRRDRRRER